MEFTHLKQQINNVLVRLIDEIYDASDTLDLPGVLVLHAMAYEVAVLIDGDEESAIERVKKDIVSHPGHGTRVSPVSEWVDQKSEELVKRLRDYARGEILYDAHTAEEVLKRIEGYWNFSLYGHVTTHMRLIAIESEEIQKDFRAIGSMIGHSSAVIAATLLRRLSVDDEFVEGVASNAMVHAKRLATWIECMDYIHTKPAILAGTSIEAMTREPNLTISIQTIVQHGDKAHALHASNDAQTSMAVGASYASIMTYFLGRLWEKGDAYADRQAHEAMVESVRQMFRIIRGAE